MSMSIHIHKKGADMNDKYEDLKTMIKAMSKEERAIVLSCIPINEILEHIGDAYSRLRETVSKIEAITKGE